MNIITGKNEKGFTLIEILIAVALLAIISAVVIPNVTGFLGRGESAAYSSDKRTIQSAVDGYYADPTNRLTGKKTYPLKGNPADKISGGTPLANGDGSAWASGAGFFIDFDLLIGDNLITDTPPSASSDNNAAATGSYSWYVKADGKVESKLASDRATTNFVPGIYP